MRYGTAGAFRQALEQRLLDRSRTRDVSLIRLRKTVAFDRLLARLVQAAPGRWVLKGALALDFRLGERMCSSFSRSCSVEMSTTVTRAPSRASSTVKRPLPAPTSSTRSPGPTNRSR